MLTPGNKKLGDKLIWSFGLPSGRPNLCVGLTEACRAHCYARKVERLRPSVRARYAENLRLSRRPDFAQRLYYALVLNRVAVVRVHSGGDFYSAGYARKWLRVMRRLPGVRFFLYTRSWRDDAIRPVLERMARRSNCRVWYSCDRQTGLPGRVPPRVRLAWLMTEADDVPPRGMGPGLPGPAAAAADRDAAERRPRLPRGGRGAAPAPRHLRPLRPLLEAPARRALREVRPADVPLLTPGLQGLGSCLTAGRPIRLPLPDSRQ